MTTRNAVLQALPDELRRRLIDASELVEIEIGAVLQEPGHQPPHVVFPESGAGSMVTMLVDGGMVEAAIIGVDTFVGTTVVLRTTSRVTRVVWQVPGGGWRLPAGDFDRIVGKNPNPAFYRAVQAISDQFAQVSACNRRHTIRQRAARWLLMVADRLYATEFELTHEFLATMLGAGRPKVSLAAQQLQNERLIRYRRGLITIVDRDGLSDVACECYAVLKRIFPGD